MNQKIKEIARKAYIEDSLKRNPKWKENEVFEALMLDLESVFEKFGELVVKECADAADMAYDARCAYVGDYVGEYMGFGVEDGIVTWRASKED